MSTNKSPERPCGDDDEMHCGATVFHTRQYLGGEMVFPRDIWRQRS